MPLSDMATRKAKTKDKAYKLTYSEGLHLLVQPNGSENACAKLEHGSAIVLAARAA